MATTNTNTKSKKKLVAKIITYVYDDGSTTVVNIDVEKEAQKFREKAKKQAREHGKFVKSAATPDLMVTCPKC